MPFAVVIITSSRVFLVMICIAKVLMGLFRMNVLRIVWTVGDIILVRIPKRMRVVIVVLRAPSPTTTSLFIALNS